LYSIASLVDEKVQLRAIALLSEFFQEASQLTKSIEKSDTSASVKVVRLDQPDVCTIKQAVTQSIVSLTLLISAQF
jgi:hypothetical protein